MLFFSEFRKYKIKFQYLHSLSELRDANDETFFNAIKKLQQSISYYSIMESF